MSFTFDADNISDNLKKEKLNHGCKTVRYSIMDVTTDIKNVIDRSDLSNEEKLGILMERYALNPEAKQVQKEFPKTETVDNKDGTITVCQGSVINGKFQRHGQATTYLGTDKSKFTIFLLAWTKRWAAEGPRPRDLDFDLEI